jgi:hypothetical protein
METVMQAVTAMRQQQAPPPHPPPPQKQNWLAEFLWTRPPLLNITREPLEADDWLKAIGHQEKILSATYQLYGPATDWWDAYSASHPNVETITWAQFRTSFCAHIILMALLG